MNPLKRSLVALVLSAGLLASSIQVCPLTWADSSNIRTYTLPTGQTVYIKESHDQPIVTLDTWVKTGSLNEVGENNGVSHFLEHLLFKGTNQYKPGEIDRILESKGSEFNAATSDDFTHFYITTASPFFEEALKLHANMMLQASIPPNELTRERKVVQEEINRSLDNPDRKVYIELAKQLYGNQGYGLDTLGPKEVIGNIPRDSILNYYHYWYQPRNLNTVIVGDVNPDKVIALIKQAFPAPSYKPSDYTPPKVDTNPVHANGPRAVILEDQGVSQAYMTLGFVGPSIENRQDVYALDVAMLALGNGKASRLYQALKETHPWVNSVSANNVTQKYTGVVAISTELKPDYIEQVKKEVLRQLTQIRTDGITQEELDKAKTQVIKDFVFQNESTDGVASSIGYNVTIGSLQDYTDYVDNIQKVTLADVQRAANKYLNYTQAVWVELLPPGKVPEQEQEKTIALLSGSQNTTPEQPTVNATQTLSPEPKKQKPVITARTLPNGLRVIMKPNPDAQTVAIKVFVKGGESVEPVAGVSPLVAEMLTQGTTHRSALALHQELESKGMNLSASAHEDAIEVTATAVKDDFETLMNILQDVLTHPAFDPKELNKEKVNLQQSIQGDRDTPSSVAFENLSLNLYPNHPYGNVGKRIEPQLKLIQRDHLVDYFKTYFTPRNMVVSVVGNFDPQMLQKQLVENFPLPETNPPTPNTPLKLPVAVVPALKQTKAISEVKAKQAATWIAQGWLAPDIKSPDYTALKVLNSLLGGGMSSRLFVDLREKQGLAYTVSSFYPSMAGKSRFVMFIGTDPVNKDKVQEGFNAEIERLKKELVSTTELQEAKDKLNGTFALAHETNLSQAYYLGLFETLGIGYQFDQTYPSLVQKVKPEDIQRVAIKYFSQPMVISVVSPVAGTTAPKAPVVTTKPAVAPEKPVTTVAPVKPNNTPVKATTSPPAAKTATPVKPAANVTPNVKSTASPIKPSTPAVAPKTGNMLVKPSTTTKTASKPVVTPSKPVTPATKPNTTTTTSPKK